MKDQLNVVCNTPELVRDAIATQALDKLLAMVDELQRDLNSDRVLQKMKSVILCVIENSFPELDKRVQVIEEERKSRERIRDFNFTKLRNSQLSDQLKEEKKLNARLMSDIRIMKRRLAAREASSGIN